MYLFFRKPVDINDANDVFQRHCVQCEHLLLLSRARIQFYSVLSSDTDDTQWNDA